MEPVKNRLIILLGGILLVFSSCIDSESNQQGQNEIYVFNENLAARWSSGENLNGEKGAGGKANNSAKGHAWDSISPGTSFSLLDIQGAGIIHRIWITISDRSPEMLRSLKIEMFWDDESKPAVSVPMGDFFGMALGKLTTFENALFTSGEGRSFSSIIQMPFRKAAKIVLTNESDKTLKMLFFDVNYNRIKNWESDYLYFHAYWSRDTATKLAEDFELLPRINGKGRFLGVSIGVNGNPLYKKTWFGEGEVKIYLDGDKEYPTLNGTGTEDYIGTAWSQGEFINNYSGCSIADNSLQQWSFYRFHIPDPVFFSYDCRITLQQIGGENGAIVYSLQKQKVPLIPITVAVDSMLLVYNKDAVFQLDSGLNKSSWVNFYRSDDVAATTYFYMDKPTNELPSIGPLDIRTFNIRNQISQ